MLDFSNKALEALGVEIEGNAMEVDFEKITLDIETEVQHRSSNSDEINFSSRD